MATLEHENTELYPVQDPSIHLPRLSWLQMLAISIFWFALSFHWAAINNIIIPSQVLKMVGDSNKGTALAFVLIPGAFVSLFANPLFGVLSDRTRGRLAIWGQRRPYILIGALVNVAGLLWLALAQNIPSLAIAYVIVQLASNAAQAPFHALLPDIVPLAQRGLASGMMGLLAIAGNVGGLLVAGIFIDTSRPFSVYQQGVWLAYAIIMVVLLAFMLITIISVRERVQPFLQESIGQGTDRSWLNRSLLLTFIWTALAVAIVWGIMALWNILHLTSVLLSSDVQVVILELVATIGLLRMFDFNPRRDPDFAWVLVTRLLVMLGITTIQTYLFYYMRDIVGAARPEQQTTNFFIVVSLTSLVSAVIAGWLSDRLGRKRIVYLAGAFMALVGLVFIVTHSLPIMLAAGAIFGLGYGAYTSVDWALVADVLPSCQNYARDMGIWNISLSLPQVIAPALGGPLIDAFAHGGQPALGFQLLFALSILYCVSGTVTVRYIRGVKM